MIRGSRTRDDRVLPFTRVLSALIIPFLVLAFVVLYVFPADTGRLFAWTINSPMTAMMLASAYLGGAYFFARALRVRHWNALSAGFAAVAVFATLLGVATLVHWDRFNHRQVAFWLWTGLYLSTPFLVLAAWLANQRTAGPARPDERRLGQVVRGTIVAIGLLAVVQGLILYAFPATMLPLWPWPLTPLTARVIGAIFCLGSAGLVVLVDRRWSTLRLILQVAALMLVLILVAAARAWREFDPARPLTWLLLGGFLAVLLGSAGLWHRMEIRGSARDEAG